jgi:hypothetical protein
MIPDLQLVVFTLPGAVSAVLSTCWLFGLLAFRPGLGFGGIIGGGDKKQTTTTITTSYQDAFNTSTSDIRSNSDLGNVTFGYPGMGQSGASSISSIAPLVVLVLAGLGGLWLVTRKS